MDLIERKAAIDALGEQPDSGDWMDEWECGRGTQWKWDKEAIENVPSVQSTRTDCEYCHEDSDGYVRPIEKNSHAWLARQGRTTKLRICFKGEYYRECDILFCPMCGRRLTDG